MRRVMSSATHHTLRILRYRALALGRWLWEQAFALFVLGPVLLGGVLWAAGRLVTNAREGLLAVAATPLPPPWSHFGVEGLAGFGMALLYTAFSLPGTLRELFAPTALAQSLNAAAVPTAARYHVALAGVLVRGLPAVPLVVLLAVLVSPGPAAVTAARWTVRLLPFLVTLGMMQIPLALLLLRGRSKLAQGGVLLAILAPILAMFYPSDSYPFALVLTAIVFWFLGLQAFIRWHRAELAAAGGRVRPASRRTSGGRRMTGPLHALVQRDLRLILRRFSPAVTTALGAAFALDLAVLLLLLDARLPVLWLRRLAVLGGTLAVLSASALLPFLVRYQLARFWIERSSGVDMELLWKAKLRTAGWLATPIFVLSAAVLMALPEHSALELMWAVFQLAAASTVVASMVGLGVFELAEQPVLGLVFSAFAALAVASLFVFYPQAWWVWLVLYMYIAGQIAGRAGRQARLLEVPR